MEIKGKYCKDCKVFIEDVEPEAMSLIYSILDCPAFEGQTVRIMPDVHAGIGIVIGFTSTLGDLVSPAHVGCDIGCTVSSMILDKPMSPENLPELERQVRKEIPFGFDIRSKCCIDEKAFHRMLSIEFAKAKSSWSEMTELLPVTVTEKWISEQLKRLGMDEGTFYKSIGTVGGGNHFIEYGEDENAKVYAMTVHCGSRNFGQKVFKFWDKIASKPLKKTSVKDIVKKIKETEADKTKWDAMIKAAIEAESEKNPAGYLSGEHLKGYMADMVFAQAYAKINHHEIHKILSCILDRYGIKPVDFIETTHNYIDFNDKIIRKGAVKTIEGERLIVPFNMRDGLAICEGLSNKDWNCSCSHGAGRKMSRSKAHQTLSLKQFEKDMEGICSTSVCESVLDECPQAYKDASTIRDLIEGTTVKVLCMCKPKANWKSK